MSKLADLQVATGLDLERRLREVLAEFAREEAELTQAFRSRRHAAQRTCENGVERADAGLAAQTEETKALLRQEEERIKAIHERRRTRIQRSHTDGMRNLPKLARREKERWLGELQMRQFQADRKRTADREAADAAHRSRSDALAGQQRALSRLEWKAREGFTGYWSFLRMLRKGGAAPAATGEATPEALQKRLDQAAEELARFRRLPLPRIFSILAFPLVALVIGLAAYMLGREYEPAGAIYGGAVALLIAVSVLHQMGRRQGKPLAAPLAATLAEARRLYDACRNLSEEKHREDHRRLEEEYERTSEWIAGQRDRAGSIEAEFEQAAIARLAKKVPRAFAKNDALRDAKLARIREESAFGLARAQANAEARKKQLIGARDTELAGLAGDEQGQWRDLEERWKRAIEPLYETIGGMNAVAASAFPEWNAELADAWNPPEAFLPATKFARLETDLAAGGEPLPKDPRLSLPGPSKVTIPLALTYPENGSLLFETGDSGGQEVMGTLNNVILRLLATTPPGKLSFTIIDPVGLGQNFAGLMHLGDYEESLINRRIWTQQDQIEERLGELNQHIEKIIQMYLRNEYATIAEYNEKAGSTAEKYHFLVIADFPANFSETAVRLLRNIIASGPRCGVFTLIHWDTRQSLPDGLVPDDLRKGSLCLRRKGKTFLIDGTAFTDGARLVFDAPPESDLALDLVHKIGQSSIDSNRVQVPFELVAPDEPDYWKDDTTNELRVAIGRTGATKLQYLAIGKGTRQHALFAGKTGSGKSTLFHVIITNLALSCSPEQVEFYLIDFKKGVEFKCYATRRLPHAKVVAIESDREFGLSVLQRVDDELKRRGDLFRKLGVQDVPGYKRAGAEAKPIGGLEPMPRCLLIIDEFQEFFVEDDSIAQTASVLFDRIVRQGRAFGIHVLLGSQTLGGAYTLARTTLGQMVIRVALQCNEADAYLIMDDNNPAPRLLSRPGEGIYNDEAGALAGNSPFQVVWLPDDDRDAWLDKVRGLAERHPGMDSSPIVFEGNAPADIRENALLAKVLDTEPERIPSTPRVWFGAPNAIKGPTEAVFHRQGGNNLLIVGQRDESALTLLGVSLLALAAQYPAGTAKFVFLHNAASDDSAFIERIRETMPHEIVMAGAQNVAEVMNDLSIELKARAAGEKPESDAPPIFLFVHGLQRFRKLRHEEDFDFSFGGGSSESAPNPGAQFGELIADGSSHGIHILAAVDTFNNINRFMSRKALSEFEMRIVFQMSANDSASLIDSPKASGLGLHRALFYNEHEGTLETFRPYATPDAEWIRQAAGKLPSLTAGRLR